MLAERNRHKERSSREIEAAQGFAQSSTSYGLNEIALRYANTSVASNSAAMPMATYTSAASLV